MSGKKKAVSIAQRIQALQSRRTKIVLIVIDLVLIYTVISGWCYFQESSYTGIFNPFELLKAVTRQLVFSRPLAHGIFEINYIISLSTSEPITINATAFFYSLVIAVPVILIIESIVVWIADMFGIGQVRKQLKPLYKLAETAQVLSKESYDTEIIKNQEITQIKMNTQQGAVKINIDSTERIHTLESAIDSLHPEQADARLHTGEKDLKGLEDAINSLIKRTRESYSQQIRFVSDASHELRTPIAVIKGYTDMLDRWGKQDKKVLAESICAIKAETEHMNKLVEQLLFLARGDSGRTQLVLKAFSLSDMVRDVYEESVMIDSKHRWELYAKDEVVAVGDMSMLKQATRILVDNAAKYTQEGETIVLKAIRDKNNNPAIVVQDNGMGIANSDLAHVFERFYRSDPSRARQQGGTGLGLSIAKWIVDRHDGFLEITSREEVGTRITIHLLQTEEIEAN